MTVLEELKSSARDSIEIKQRELERLLADAHSDKEKSDKELRDSLLDILSQVRTEYQTTVAEARNAESVERVAELWKETRNFYSALLNFWRAMETRWGDTPKDELFVFCRELIEKLERASAQAHEFHS
jgi:hypothetical protein